MSERANPRWQRRKDTRPDEILDAARKVFGELGAKASLKDIATAAGCSKGLILLYYGSKAELWWRAMGTVYVGPRARKAS